MTAPTPNGASGESERCDPVADGQTFSGVRCELCGVVRMNAMESRDEVVRCQDSFICEQVAALVAGARSTYDDLIEAGWRPVTTAPVPASGESERCDNYLPPMTCWTAPSTETGRCGYCSAHPAAPAPVPVGSPQDEDVEINRAAQKFYEASGLSMLMNDKPKVVAGIQAAIDAGHLLTRAEAERMQAEAVEAAAQRVEALVGPNGEGLGNWRDGRQIGGYMLGIEEAAAAARARTEGKS